MKPHIADLRLKIPPSDRVVLALLVLAVVVALWRWPSVGAALTPFVLQQALMLMVFTGCVVAMTRWEQSRFVLVLRPVVTIGVVFTCYSSLGRMGLTAFDYRGDAALSACDVFLLGYDPAMAIQSYQTRGAIEFFSVIYGWFIPYIYLSLFLGCLGRRPVERDQFLTGWVLVYSISYLGYLFVPAQGPVVFQADRFTTALDGGMFHGLVVQGIEAVGGPKGAFPSLHVGASVYLCLFDLSTNRLRGMTYLPIVILIYVATVFLRYHYVVDLMAGTLIAVASVPLGRRLFRVWAEARMRSGLPALPGGESDSLSILSGADPAGSATVFPTHRV